MLSASRWSIQTTKKIRFNTLNLFSVAFICFRMMSERMIRFEGCSGTNPFYNMIKKLHFLIWIGLSFINLKGNAQGCAALFNGVSTEAYVLTTPVSIHNFTVSLWFKAYGPGPLFSSSEDSSGLTGLGDKRIWIDGTGTLYCGVYSPGVNVINSNTMVLDSS